MSSQASEAPSKAGKALSKGPGPPAIKEKGASGSPVGPSPNTGALSPQANHTETLVFASSWNGSVIVLVSKARVCPGVDNPIVC